MRLQLGVFGAHREKSESTLRTAAELGRLIATHGHVLITGGAAGVSRAAAEGALTAEGTVVTFLPGRSEEALSEGLWVAPQFVTVWTGMGYRGRNLLAVRSCHGAFVVSGGIGTLTEVALALAEDVPVCALNSTGGIARRIEEICTWLPHVADLVLVEAEARAAFELLCTRAGRSSA